MRDNPCFSSSIWIVDSSFFRSPMKRKTENEVVWKGCISLPIAMVHYLAERGGESRSGTIAKMIAASAGYRAWIKEQQQ